MKNKNTDPADTGKSDASAPSPAGGTKPRGAEKESRVQKDAMARSRGESPTANKPSERSPRQENL